MKSSEKNLFNRYSRRPAECHWKVFRQDTDSKQSFALPWGVRVMTLYCIHIPLDFTSYIYMDVVKNYCTSMRSLIDCGL